MRIPWGPLAFGGAIAALAVAWWWSESGRAAPESAAPEEKPTALAPAPVADATDPASAPSESNSSVAPAPEPSTPSAEAWSALVKSAQARLAEAPRLDPTLMRKLMAELDEFVARHEGAEESVLALLNHAAIASQVGEEAAAEASLRRAAPMTEDPELRLAIRFDLAKLSVKPGVAPPDFQAKTLAGASISPDDFKGKVLLLDFWATWCGPCIAELPNLKQVYARYHEAGLEIVGISLDDSRELLGEFIDANKMSWSHIFNDDLPDEGNLAILYGVNTIPRTVLLGRDGKIAAVDMRGPELEEQVKRALAVR